MKNIKRIFRQLVQWIAINSGRINFWTMAIAFVIILLTDSKAVEGTSMILFLLISAGTTKLSDRQEEEENLLNFYESKVDQ